ncbi:MAG: hypothetical protein ACOYMA_10685 [Bacteroidia bacterium]
MNKLFYTALVLVSFLACSKSDTVSTPSQTIITSDSSQYSGRLKVTVLDGTNNNAVINGAQVFLYPTYEDLKRNFYLNTVSSVSGIADFGYILQGNYYLRAQSGIKSDTNVVQVLGQKTITRTMIVK